MLTIAISYPNDLKNSLQYVSCMNDTNLRRARDKAMVALVKNDNPREVRVIEGRLRDCLNEIDKRRLVGMEVK